MVVIVALALAPELGSRPTALPPAIPVELVAAPAQAPPAPAPPSEPPASKPKPPAPAEKVVLPEEAADVAPEPTPEPEPAPEPRPEPTPEPEPRPEPQPQPQKSLEDVMRELRAGAGEPEPAPERTARAEAGAAAGAPGGSARGAEVSPEVAAWLRRARIHVRNQWVLAPGFRTQDLEAHVRVELDAQGRVVGEPEITRPSGNPWYDESVVRALVKASPLPAPPEPGEWPFVFQPGDAL